MYYDGNLISSVLFDMDGVIVNSMSFHVASWKQVFREEGITLEDIDIYKREGMSGLESIRDIFIEKGHEAPSDEKLSELIARKHEFFNADSISLYKESPDILSFLDSNGIKLALVTGSVRRSVERMIPKEVSSLFSAIITADDVVKGKPHPEPYLKAVENLDTRSERCLVIENAPMGIKSAKASGIKCFAVETTLSGSYLSEADMVFDNHGNLFSYIRNLVVEKTDG